MSVVSFDKDLSQYLFLKIVIGQLLVIITQYRCLYFSKLFLCHFWMKRICQLFFSFCYLPHFQVPDKKIDTILSTVRAVTRQRLEELAHRSLA